MITKLFEKKHRIPNELQKFCVKLPSAPKNSTAQKRHKMAQKFAGIILGPSAFPASDLGLQTMIAAASSHVR